MREDGFELGLVLKSFGVMGLRRWLCGYTDPRTWMADRARAKRASVFRGKMSDTCIAALHTGTSYTHVQIFSVIPSSSPCSRWRIRLVPIPPGISASILDILLVRLQSGANNAVSVHEQESICLSSLTPPIPLVLTLTLTRIRIRPFGDVHTLKIRHIVHQHPPHPMFAVVLDIQRYPGQDRSECSIKEQVVVAGCWGHFGQSGYGDSSGMWFHTRN